MEIKIKADIEEFLFQFCLFSEWDGTKFFITITDEQTKGFVTLMQYPDEQFTFHRKNDHYWDLFETPLNREQVMRFIWKHRKALNKLRERNLIETYNALGKS
jgi:hypothetical protein